MVRGRQVAQLHARPRSSRPRPITSPAGRKPSRLGPTSLYWHECRSSLVFDQHHQEFGRLRTACVPINDMNIVGAFIEGLSRRQGYLLSTLDLHHDGAFQHVDHRMGIVSVDRARPPGRMLHDDHQHFLAGILRKIFRHKRRDLGLLSHRRAGHEAEQNHGNECGPHGASLGSGVRQDRAFAGERRSHSSRPIRPRRASPNGTRERSSTRPPQYLAWGSSTTVRGSPTAFRNRATISLNGARSGPAISTMPLRGGASATSATAAATATAAIGWNRPGEILTLFPAALESAMAPRNSMNWVERMMVYGMPEVLISFSCATLARK